MKKYIIISLLLSSVALIASEKEAQDTCESCKLLKDKSKTRMFEDNDYIVIYTAARIWKKCSPPIALDPVQVLAKKHGQYDPVIFKEFVKNMEKAYAVMHPEAQDITNPQDLGISVISNGEVPNNREHGAHDFVFEWTDTRYAHALTSEEASLSCVIL